MKRVWIAHRLRTAATLCLGLILVSGTSSAFAQDAELDSSFVLYKFQGKLIRDSKWGKIAALQRALSQRLEACGRAGIGSDGIYGRNTQAALLRLLSCPGFEEFAVPADHPLYGTVHSALWQRILPDTPLPTVRERAFALSLSHEATDYDRVEWNYGTDDDASALTWGPYGATVGWGNEVRGILAQLNERAPQLIQEAFRSEFPTVQRLIDEDAGMAYELLKPVHSDARRRADWRAALQQLGSSELGRAAYDDYAFASGKWLTPAIQRLYGLIPNAEARATEVDYAFFLDLAMHASVSGRRIRDANQAIDALGSELGRALTPAERRHAIGDVFANAVNPRWRLDRLGRNVVFYVDGVETQELGTEERTAWARRTGRSASEYGLLDDRRYYPDFLR